MAQLASAGKVSMLVSVLDPPLMINPVMRNMHAITNNIELIRIELQIKNYQLGNCLLGRCWLLGQGGEVEAPR